MISTLTINTHNSIKDILSLDWTTFKAQYKLYAEYVDEREKERKKLYNK